MIRLLVAAAFAASASAQVDPCGKGTVESRAKAGCVPSLAPAPGLSVQKRAAPASEDVSRAEVAQWKVFDRAGRLALVFSDKPGPLTGTALSPGGPPVNHPFLSGSARDPESENRLHDLLEASRGVREFIARLKHDGYRVERIDPGGAPSAVKIDPGSAWEVLKDGRLVLRLKDSPGPLYGTALPPPGVAPPNHPFLSGSALDPAEEGRLKKLLDASVGTADYLARLRLAGYEVRPQSAPVKGSVPE